jgi:hypothetical protein
LAHQPKNEEKIMANVPISKEEILSVVPVMALLTVACKANGIARTTAWKLAKLGLLDTVSIGRRRYVLLSSFEKLPERLAALKGSKA